MVPFVATEELDEPPAIPANSPIRDLDTGLESVPEDMQAGDDLVFVVVLENPTDNDVVLDPCPAYNLNFGESASTVRSGFRLLNCEGGQRVPAGGSLSFEMRISTTSNVIQPDRHYRLVWRLEPDLSREITHLSTT